MPDDEIIDKNAGTTPTGLVAADGGARPFLPQRRLLLLVGLLSLVMWTDLVRYMDPIGEKHFPLLEPGAADFSVIFDGTRAFLDGRNPYYYRDADSADRWGRGDIIGGRWFRVAYQPSHFLVYIPLALITADNREAGRIIFVISVALYFLLAYMTWRLVLRVAEPLGDARRFALLLLPILVVLVVANVGSALSLARCQSDVINAVLCWGAIALFLRGRRFWPLFLVTTAISIKGYAALLGLGLFFLGLRRVGWRATVCGALSAMAFWILPVAPYLRDGAIASVSHATGFFSDIYFNHSFANVFFHVSPGLTNPGRLAATGLGVCVSVASWWQTRRALREEAPSIAALWMAVFATASLTTMVGVSTLSYIYNQILILPGTLVLFSLGDHFWQTCGFSVRGARWLLAFEYIVGFLLFKYSLAPLGAPLAGLGNLLLLILFGVGLVGRRLSRQ